MMPWIRPKRLFLLVMAATIPALLFVNVWQGVRYTRLKAAVRQLEDEQTAWYERNKNLLAAIGIHSSPRRLEALAERDRDARKAGPEDTVRVEVDTGSSTGKGR